MVAAMLAFTSNDMVIKHLAETLPILEIIALRGVCVIVLLVAWFYLKPVAPMPLKRVPWISARALMEVLATVTFLFALTRIPLSDAVAVLQALPLVVTLGAAIFLKESVGWRRWFAIAVGFVGVLIIIRPGLSGFQPAILLVVLAVLFAAARDLFTKSMPADVPSYWITTATAFFVCGFGMAATTVTDAWQPVTMAQLGLLSIASCLLLAAYLSIIQAMRLGDVSSVAPFRYTSLLWAIVGGLVFFAEVPDPMTLLGSTMVVGMGLFAWYRERVLASAARRAE